MFDVDSYVTRLTDLLAARFEKRLVYVGLQGSYLRGEATEKSDLDIMAVVDELRPEDLDAYRACVDSLEHPEKSCGFICGEGDLRHWNPLEICHLFHTTRDVYGVLARLVPPWRREDALCYVKLSVGNLYHALCHRRVHSDRENCRAGLWQAAKPIFFVLQDLYFLRTGIFAQSHAELLPLLCPEDGAVLRLFREESDYETAFALLMRWCQKTLAETDY